MVRKLKSTEEDLAEAAKLVQYHVYDICEPKYKLFYDRFNILGAMAEKTGGPIHLVPTTYCENQDKLDELYSEYTEDGYEGQMVRLDYVYEHKRSKGLLKRKEFTTEEFKVVEVL